MAAQIPFGWSVRSRRPIDDRYIVADLTARDALDTFRRHEGLFCYVESDDKTYKLVGGITNTDWVEVLDNIGELGVGTPDTAADSVAYFDVTEGVHKKVLIQDLVSGSKWTEGTGNDIYRINGAVGIGVNPLSPTKLHVRLPSAFPLYDFRFQTPTISGLLSNSPELAIGRVDNDNWIKIAPFSAGGSYPIIQSWGGTLLMAFNKGTSGLLMQENKITYASASFIEHNTSSSFLTFQNAIGRYRFNRTNAGGIPMSLNASIANELEWIVNDLPTADPLVSGQVWNDSGTLKISAG